MNLISELLAEIFPNNSGQSLQLAVFFSAIGFFVAIFGIPLVDSAVKNYAKNRAFGIDRVITGSVEKSERYTIRRSVLDGENEVCMTDKGEPC